MRLPSGIVILNHGNKEEGFAQLCRVVGGMRGGRGSDCLLQYALITACMEEGEVTACYSMP